MNLTDNVIPAKAGIQEFFKFREDTRVLPYNCVGADRRVGPYLKIFLVAGSIFLFLLFSLGAGISSAGENDKMYVSMTGDIGVAVVDPIALQAWGVIKTGNYSAKMKASPDGRFLYVSETGDKRVKCIDTFSDKIIKEVDTGASPYNMDISPDGKILIVCNNNGKSLSLIDTGTFKEVKRVQLDGLPQAVAVSRDGTTAYIAIGEQGVKLGVLDIKKLEVQPKISLPDQVYQIELSPDGGRLYASSAVEHKILAIDTASLKVTDQIETRDSYRFAISKDGSELWFAGRDKLNVYSTVERKVIAQVPCRTAESARMIFSPDGKRLFAARVGRDGKTMFVYDARRKIKIGEIELPGSASDIVYLER